MSTGIGRKRALRAFARQIGLPRGTDLQLLDTALTHESYASEHPQVISNERLEFLGDAILGAVVGSWLFERHPQKREGQLSRLRAALVSRHALAGSAQTLGIGPLIALGRGERDTGGAQRASLLVDAFEALVGVAFLSGGMDAAACFVQRHHLDQATLGETTDPKTRLQELTQAKFKKAPHYAVIAQSGPPHARVFSVEVEVAGQTIGRGTGPTKKQAQANAAREALAHLS